MKNRFIVVLIIIAFFNNRCSGQVNTTDPQVSKSIEDSKKNGVFIKQYKIESTSDKEIILEVAWLEKTWGYKKQNGKFLREEKYGCQLCFMLKQTPNLKYNIKEMSKGLMKKANSNVYVGYAYGLYRLSLPGCIVNDTINIDLMEIEKEGVKKNRKKVGTIVFKAVL